MSKKIITFDLSESGIERAIKELKDYKNELDKKCEELRRRVAERIESKAQPGFNGAIVDDVLKGARSAHVYVSVKDEGDVTLVIAYGNDAVWVEFGAGVYHNGAVGSSPNPYGSELGFTIGSYGTNGARDIWGFYENGELVLTHGTPAAMPLFHAVQDTIDEIQSIAKEVFG